MKSMITVALLLVVVTALAEENSVQQARVQQEGSAFYPGPFPKPPGRPWWGFSGEERDARQMVEESPEPTHGTLPEASNYAVSAEPFGCCFVCLFCFGRKKRSVLPSLQAPEDEILRFFILGSATEMKLYNTVEDIRELYQTPVTRVELYERPLDPVTSPSVAQALGYKQSAVVVTLRDGRRFMLVKGNNRGEGRQTTIILGDHMTDDWVKVQAKDVTRSVLLDFAKAGGLLFDALHDNGKDAALRMFALD